jgi:hypothetical protein
LLLKISLQFYKKRFNKLQKTAIKNDKEN